MARPKLFIGSSKKNLLAAQYLANGLDSYATVTVWNEGVFGLSQGVLETLLEKLTDYDFAAFVLAADDMTRTEDALRPSPRDNVLFESGLFMGVLGRERVFLVCDQSVSLKIPSDLAGVTLAQYDGPRLTSSEASSAVRNACIQIGSCINAAKYPYLVGDWRSAYLMTVEDGSPIIEEDVDVYVSGGAIVLSVKSNPMDDSYTATGRMLAERQIVGKWKSRVDKSDTKLVESSC